MKKAENFQRSAIAPVGMVAAVSMNTTANRNIARLAGVVADIEQRELAQPEQSVKTGRPDVIASS